jgi:colicin import membrane protein
MTTELERAAQISADILAADERRKADAEESALAGERLDKILACLDAMGKRLDAYESGREEAKGKEEEAGDGDEPEEKGDPKPIAADSRKDSQMVRSDSDAEEIEHFKRETGAQYEIKADSVLAAIQSDADKASSSWGRDAPHPWDGERITAYRRRTARQHQQYSPLWRDVDLSTLSGQTLRNAVSQIFSDSISASSCGESYGETMREVRRRDPDTGHLIKEYYGSPLAWMSQFMPARRSAKFNLDRRRDDR